jgi:hypothetical protein
MPSVRFARVRGLLLPLVLFLALMLAGDAARSAALPQVFESSLIRYVLTRTKPGAVVLSQVTSTQFELMTESTYSAFLQRMAWQQNAVLRDRLGEEFQTLSRDFGAFRRQNGRPEAIEAGEVLGAQDREFLEQWGDRVLRSSQIDDLLIESRNFFVVPAKAPKISESLRQQIAESANVAYSGQAEVPTLPIAAAEGFAEGMEGQANLSTPVLREFERTFWSKVGDRYRAYRTYWNVFKLSEGDLRSLYTLTGKTFSPKDLELLRKANRLLDVLNEYSRTRLVMRAFVMERPQLYDRLNERTVQATSDFLEGVLSEADFLALRRKASEELKMNAIVPEAEKRMLESVRRLKELGGGIIGGQKLRAQIDLSEDNLALYSQQLATAEEYARRIQAKIDEIQRQLRSASSDQRVRLDQALRQYRQNLQRELADAELARGRQRTEAEALGKMYLEFVQAYDSLELFVNIRFGKINSEQTQVFNLSDALVPSAYEIQEWKNFYDKALANSVNDLVRSEVHAFSAAHLGATRQFVVDMNKWTGKYFGKKFTESPFGREFLEYNKSVVRVFLIRFLVLIGVVGTPAAAEKIVDAPNFKETFLDPLVQKLWDAMFSIEAEPAAIPANGGGAPSPSRPRTVPAPAATPSPAPSSTSKPTGDVTGEASPPPPTGGPAGGRRIVIGFPNTGINPPKPDEGSDAGSKSEDPYQ